MEKINNLFFSFKQSLWNNRCILLSAILLLIYLSPNIFFQKEARFLIHDNLNSNVVWYKNLAESGKLLGSNNEIIPNSLGGLPRGCYPSEYYILPLLYLLFSPLMAYNINIVLMHILAFISMYVFANRYIFKYEYPLYTSLLALCFSLLPFWPSGGAAITCQPLLLYALLNIYHKDLNWKNWAIIIFIPFYSIVILSNLFFLILIGLFYAYTFIKERRINYWFGAALMLFVLTTVFCEQRLFQMQFVEHFASQRADMRDFGSLNIKGIIGVSVLHFLFGQYHFYSLHFPLIFILSVMAFVFCKQYKVKRNILLGLMVAYLVSFLFIIPDWVSLQNAMKNTSLIKSLSLRFYSLYPLIWYIIMGYSVYVLIELGKKIISISVISIMFLIIGYNMFSINTKDYFKSDYAENSFFMTYFNKKDQNFDTFRGYYQVDLFNKLKKVFPPNGEYIGCIGMDPEIAQFNGYYTIDGYYYYQPRLHNRQMIEISSQEMKKINMPMLASNHSLLISSEYQEGKPEINDLKLDFTKMKELKCRYVLSSLKINNGNLNFICQVGENGQSLFLYKIV